MKKILIWILGLFILFSITGYVFSWFGEASTVAKEEFGAKASLKKYEWFKNAAETIQEKKQTIKIYESNISAMENDYKNVPRNKWSRLDKQQYNQWKMEIAGLKASYNKVVKEYNAQSSKFNWRLYNTSNLPKHYDLYIND